MEHSNSRTFQGLLRTFKDLLCFQGLSRAWNFFFKIQGLSRTSQGPYEPCRQHYITTSNKTFAFAWVHVDVSVDEFIESYQEFVGLNDEAVNTRSSHCFERVGQASHYTLMTNTGQSLAVMGKYSKIWLESNN